MLLRNILHVVTVRHTRASSNKTQNVRLLGSFCRVRPGSCRGQWGGEHTPSLRTRASGRGGTPPRVSGLCLHVCSDVSAAGTNHGLWERLLPDLYLQMPFLQAWCSPTSSSNQVHSNWNPAPISVSWWTEIQFFLPSLQLSHPNTVPDQSLCVHHGKAAQLLLRCSILNLTAPQTTASVKIYHMPSTLL